MAFVDHAGGGFLHYRSQGSAVSLRQAGDSQHRSGHQFTSIAFTDVLKNAGIKISMDVKGAWRNNVFVERLWRTIKNEEVYLHAYENVPQARAGIKKYLTFYNEKRPHSSLDRQTSDQVYFNQLQPIPAAT